MDPIDPSPGATSLDAENEALLQFLYVIPVGLLEIAADGTVAMMNPLAAQLLVPLAGPAGMANLFDALAPFAPDLRFIAASYTEPRGPICEARRIHVGQADGKDARILACSLIKIDEARIMAILSDITEQVTQERRLKQAESWFSLILSGVKDFALLSLNAQGRVLAWNKSGERLTGHPPNAIVGHTLNVLYPPDEAVQGRALQQVDFARRDGWHIDEGWRMRRDGTRFWCQSLVSALEEKTGEITGFSVVLRDVTEQRASAEEVRRLLTTDQLTGVCNRARFFELAEAEITRWNRYGQPLSALMIDIDHFKRINDTFGHAGGDQVLRQVAEFFLQSFRTIDVVGRLGGEEFAILMPSIDREGAKAMAEMVRCGVAAIDHQIGGERAEVTVSIGCAELGPDAGSIDELLHAADQALYVAKRTGRNKVEVFRAEDHTRRAAAQRTR